MKISFDFDNTLSKPKCQNIARKLKLAGHDICITTTRQSNKHGIKFDNSDLFDVAKELDITDITFTEAQNKVEFLKKNNVEMHIDDDRFEIDLLKDSGIIGILVNDSFWIKKIFNNIYGVGYDRLQ